MSLPTERQAERYEPALRGLSALLDLVAPHAARKPADAAPAELLAEARSVLSEVRYIASRLPGAHLPPLTVTSWLAIQARLLHARTALQLFRQHYWGRNRHLQDYAWQTVEMAELDRELRAAGLDGDSEDGDEDEGGEEDEEIAAGDLPL